MEPMIEKMGLADFEALPIHGERGSWQRQVLLAMEINTPIILEHDGLACKVKTGGGCTLVSMASILSRQHPERRWSARHLKDGRVAVACFAAEEVPSEN